LVVLLCVVLPHPDLCLCVRGTKGPHSVKEPGLGITLGALLTIWSAVRLRTGGSNECTVQRKPESRDSECHEVVSGEC
jgi:hypothetical protein